MRHTPSSCRWLTAALLLSLGVAAQGQVLTGIEVLKRENFKPLQGRTVGIITNHTGLDAQGNRIIDLLVKAPGVKVVKLFSPEHGLYGVKDEKVGDTIDPDSGLKVMSLYGQTRRPTAEMLEGIDTLVFDIQDVGARYYTYESTMGICMEEAAKRGLRFVVLDRPNPITGNIVAGPIADEKHLGFTAFRPVPVSHGMTIGELAKMFNDHFKINCDLQVIEMEGWRRDMWWEQTGVKWVNPSPNMRSTTEALLYLGVGLMEASNISVGRGTDIPFELIGAPWIKSEELAKALNDLELPGLEFTPHDFTPVNTPHKYNKVPCHGVKITVTDRDKVQPVEAGVAMAWTLRKLYPKDYDFPRVVNLLQNSAALEAIQELNDPRQATQIWANDLAEFKKVREKYLIYK
jgi:uncharacterized protein YbbC (DUF1343 family)